VFDMLGGETGHLDQLVKILFLYSTSISVQNILVVIGRTAVI